MKKRLLFFIIAFCVSFASMVALSLYSMERFTTFTTYSDLVDQTHAVINELYKTEGCMKDLDRTERGYILTRDTIYTRYLNNAIDSVQPYIKHLETLLSNNKPAMAALTIIKADIALRVNYARQNIEYADSVKMVTPSSYYFDGRKVMLDISHHLRDIHKSQNELLAANFKNQEFYQKLTTTTLKYLLFVFCFVTLILFAIMIKELRGRMKFQEELKSKIIDLRRSHSELEEIAYAASHDLQEPLRKIQVFSNMMLYQKKGGIDKENEYTLERINHSANRMQLLISDLISLTNLTKTEEEKLPADINRMIQYILIDLNDKIKDKAAHVQVQQLPIIEGYDNQLKILFTALLDNSLKFTREGVNPMITITCEKINGHELSAINPNLLHRKFYRITCSDNGIGFDDKYIDKIFRIFQRLHNQQSDYEGKGIGLAICQRIMANHEGYMMAHGELNMGAQFKLFFPVED